MEYMESLMQQRYDAADKAQRLNSMKKVTITTVHYFEEDTPDEVCFACANEAHGQMDLNDDNYKIEYNQAEPEYED